MDIDPKSLEAGIKFSPIIIASIGAAGGLASGILASLIAPWVHYGIELRRKSFEYKANRIKDTRALLDKAESLTDILNSSLWGFISNNLNETERGIVFPKGLVIWEGGADQDSYKKSGISIMLSRLEKEWKLIT